MNSSTDRVVFNRDLDPQEYVTISIFMMGYLSKYSDHDLYYYVEVKESLDLNITTFEASEIQWQANELMCTDQQALIAVCEYDGFYEEVLITLWENGIGDYNRYVVQTKESIISDEEPPFCIAKTEEDAYHYFANILHLEDILTVREDNEETL